jgi:MFS transporter, FLVCR family, MFS-domain-containing protein 7
MTSKNPVVVHHAGSDGDTSASASASGNGNGGGINTRLDAPPLNRTLSRITTASTVEYRVYKRRFIGLAQLALLNIAISWDWITFAPVSDSAATFFTTTESVINWASTAFLFAFCVATPFTSWTLHRYGPRLAIIIAAVLTLAGNGIKYGGTQSSHFAVMMVGQLLVGLAQPFALASATSYSNLWFTPQGRTTATALISLANPFGAAIGQLISPFWVTRPAHIPRLVGFVAIISAVISAAALFVPGTPPTPPSAASASSSRNTAPSTTDTTILQIPGSLLDDLRTLTTSLEFYLLFLPFTVYVGFFNAFSSLINQILSPHNFTEDESGIAGAILIVVGLLAAAATSPYIDRSKRYLLFIRLCVPLVALSYLILIFAPDTTSLPFVYVICALLGAASFTLVPVALEFLVEIFYPVSEGLGSTLCWSGGQLLGGIFIVVMDALKERGTGDMKRALIFQAVLACLVAPAPLCLGLFGRGEFVRKRRWELDLEGESGSGQGQGRGQIRVEDAEGIEDGVVDEDRLRVRGAMARGRWRR